MSNDIREHLKEKLAELEVYASQGLEDAAQDLAVALCEEIAKSDLSQEEKARYIKVIESIAPWSVGVKDAVQVNGTEDGDGKSEIASFEVTIEDQESDPESQFQYAKTLMQIHDWDRAIDVLKAVAATGYRLEECYELCGDCAANSEKWSEALKYYETVYSQPGLRPEDRERLLAKMSRCQQKKFRNRMARKEKIPQVAGEHTKWTGFSETFVSEHVSTLYNFVGRVANSWSDANNGWTLAGDIFEYEIREFLHIGRTRAVFEVFCKQTGKTYAADTFMIPWRDCLSIMDIIEWAHVCKMMMSDYVDIPYDVAMLDNLFFIVRDYYEKTLIEYMSENPQPSYEEACLIAYQILEGIGYLHTHLGRDKQKRKIYHLDLRPSRIMLRNSIGVKVALGGLWKLFRSRCGKYTNPRNLPLGILPYKAPEQFRTYLWGEKRSQVCTDVYSFGVIFYELLTGINPFQGESVEECEILHCAQKPIPPQVCRPDMPEELNEIIMKCLEVRPQKRWRSSTQILLSIERFLGGAHRVFELFKEYGVLHSSTGGKETQTL
ncbi:MAG TPA: serine/threonine protein kinase [Thermodesulforhabdus norvegica]|uniref:Serine/threonine protein kinase n=1 Tax=Thermodesulforhabdus norvegica TaxID=39841 RepID=A0A7C1AXJ3_9BACT|nr:serine/threonine protein kinase [Thermodesulforhabdus norvegica]